MSKWTKDPEIQKDIKNRISKIEITRREVTGSYFEQIMPKVVEHYKEHIDDDEIFYEGKSAFVLIKTFEKPDVLPKATKSEWSDEYTRRLACSWKNGILGVFATDDQWSKIGWNAPAWVRGKLTVKFDLMGYEQKYHKSIDLACKKNGVDRDSIDDSDVIKNYTLNIWQVVE